MHNALQNKGIYVTFKEIFYKSCSLRNVSTPSPLVNVMVSAIFKAARGLLRDFGEVERLQTSRKGPEEFVMMADQRSERLIYRELSAIYPHHNFLMEETGLIQNSESTSLWIIDPLDGSNNFIHGIPHFSLSVAFQENGKLVAGVIYDPLKDELFWTHKSLGAYMNQQRLRVPEKRTLDRGVISTSIPSRRHSADQGRIVTRVMQQMKTSGVSFRCFGVVSLDLAYVAAGRYNAAFEQVACPWDMAAGVLLLQEAGGIITDLAGGPKMLEKRQFVAGHGVFHSTLTRVLQENGSLAPSSAESSLEGELI
jgi:myo-inositol-1(or 4)-monophosphatase